MTAGTPCEIAYWLGTRRRVPDVVEIMDRWKVSRPSAYRWRAFALSGGQRQSVARERVQREHAPTRRHA